jgi:flavin-dependent dehydrogenase
MGAGAIAVVGDGPAGSTLATLLARAGRRVAMFSRGRPAGLLVGESMVPAVVPLLRRLGIEDEVRTYAEYKPGATFGVRAGDSLAIEFAGACTRVPGYAYNVPRERFDATLQACARKSGAHVVEGSARLVASDAGTLALDPAASAEATAVLGRAPDFVVDATGRARSGARVLRLPTDEGPRRDDALFAHWEGVPLERAGHVHSDRLSRGWCWRIPLPGRVSMGIVAPRDALREHGDDPEAQYRAVCAAEPHLVALTKDARRISGVARYSNYQLTTDRATGPGWALVGDAFGFVDPVFSSGLFLAMQGAASLADALVSRLPGALSRYERSHRRHLRAWRDAVDLFYDGRFFALLRLRSERPGRGPKRLIHDHVSRHVPRIFTGEGSAGGYAPHLLDFVAEHALRGYDEPAVD